MMSSAIRFAAACDLAKEVFGCLTVCLGRVRQVLIVRRVRVSPVLVFATEDPVVFALLDPGANFGEAQHVERMALAHEVEDLEDLIRHIAGLPVLLCLNDEFVQAHLVRRPLRRPSSAS